jgi:hypothetical protein
MSRVKEQMAPQDYDLNGWQPIETAPKGMHILYFPPGKWSGENENPEMVRVDYFPVNYPRQPTHWMPIPKSPVAR